MHYVYINKNIVIDQCQVDPYSIFSEGYASQFIEAPDEVTFEWSLIDGKWVAPIVPSINWQEMNKANGITLLQQTDWAATVDIANPQYSNPYLTNQNDFLSYRSLIRSIVVNPPDTEATFPTVPTSTWSS